MSTSKFEPLVLHVVCRALDGAQEMVRGDILSLHVANTVLLDPFSIV